jgi:hypothetical protein
MIDMMGMNTLFFHHIFMSYMKKKNFFFFSARVWVCGRAGAGPGRGHLQRSRGRGGEDFRTV